MTASRKLAHDNSFLIIFFHKKAFYKNRNCITIQKCYIALNLYIDINELVYERR